MRPARGGVRPRVVFSLRPAWRERQEQAGEHRGGRVERVAEAGVVLGQVRGQEERDAAEWDPAAKPYLETFLRMHTPYAGPLASERPLTDAELEKALTRKGKPAYTGEDIERLLFEPLDAARRRLRLSPPIAYDAVPPELRNLTMGA